MPKTTSISPYHFSTDATLKNIVSQIVSIADPDKIILFGSRAMGTQNDESDYDIFVLKKYIKRRRKLASKIRMGIDVLAPIDIVVNTPAQFDKLKDKWFFIYYDIEKYGKLLYEK